MSFKETILFSILLTLKISSFCQCEILDSAQSSFKSKNYKQTIDLLNKCKSDSSIYLNQLIEFKKGLCYHEMGQDSMTKNTYLKLYDSFLFVSPDNFRLKCKNGSTNWLGDNGQYRLYRLLLLRLFEISFNDSQYHLALNYLHKMDSIKLFEYCGNAFIGSIHNQILRYSEVYDKMSEPDSALLYLLPYLIHFNFGGNPTITKNVLSLISKNYNISEVKKEFEKAVKNIKMDSFTVNIERFVKWDSLNKKAEYEVIPTSLITYSMVFMGVKMILFNDRDYYTTEKNPSFKAIRRYCLNSQFYQGLTKLKN